MTRLLFGLILTKLEARRLYVIRDRITACHATRPEVTTASHLCFDFSPTGRRCQASAQQAYNTTAAQQIALSCFNIFLLSFYLYFFFYIYIFSYMYIYIYVSFLFVLFFSEFSFSFSIPFTCFFIFSLFLFLLFFLPYFQHYDIFLLLPIFTVLFSF